MRTLLQKRIGLLEGRLAPQRPRRPPPADAAWLAQLTDEQLQELQHIVAVGREPSALTEAMQLRAIELEALARRRMLDGKPEARAC